jgi:hypothetical protein
VTFVLGLKVRLRAEDARAALDGARLRPLPASRLVLSGCDDFLNLGHLRPCRPRRGRAGSKARYFRLDEGPFLAGVIGLRFVFLLLLRTEGRQSSVASGAFVVLFAGVAADPSTGVLSIGAIVFAVAVAVAVALAFYSPFSWTVDGVAIIFAGTAAGAVWFLWHVVLEHRRQSIFFSLFLPTMILACLGLAVVLSPLKTWDSAGPFLLFLGLLTLLNAPFDWASLGLTRALLRRGLELGEWWPYLLALVDAALAAVIIAALALVMVIGVQAFDELGVHAAASPSCRWTPSSTVSPRIRRPRNIGGPMRFCSRP